MNCNDTVFSSVSLEIVDGLLDGLGNGTHRNDDFFCVRCSVVLERTIVASGEFAEFAHVACNYIRNCLIELVSGLYRLEIYVAVLCSTSCYRCLRSKSSCSEFLQRLGADHISEIILIDGLDLLDFV